MEDRLSRQRLTTAASPPRVVVLTLPTQATFNDGQSSFKKKHLTTAANPLKLTWHFQHRQHSMMENHLSKGHLTTAATPPEVDLLLPSEATFNGGESSFNSKGHLTTAAHPPEIDRTLPVFQKDT